MTPVNPKPELLDEHEIEIRVRYQETDAQGHVHHANYISYFEVGRIEMLRACGHSYRDLEDSGIMLVVVETACQYFKAARYDDLLRLKTKLVKAKGVRIEHHYEVTLDDELVAKGKTVVASVDRSGKVVKLPECCLLYTSPSPRDATLSRMPSSA